MSGISDREFLVSLFRDLEEYVVSLDRISSRIAFGADPRILMDYMSERRVLRRLAETRKDLTKILEEIMDPAELDQIAESSYVYVDPDSKD